MLYVNVYLVSRVLFSHAEGGCYYDQGSPLASIPVDSDYKPGKEYYLSEGVHIRDCYCCSGTGEVDIDPEDGSECYRGRCEDCGLIPESPEDTWKAIQKYQEFFKDEPGRYEEIRVCLQDHFATSFPETRPTYE